MLRRPPRSTRTDTLFPYTTLFRSLSDGGPVSRGAPRRRPARQIPEPASGGPVCMNDDRTLHAHLIGRQGSRADLNTPALILDIEARSEEHTSELQSLMRISYAVFCLKKKQQIQTLIKHKSNQRY